VTVQYRLKHILAFRLLVALYALVVTTNQPWLSHVHDDSTTFWLFTFDCLFLKKEVFCKLQGNFNPEITLACAKCLTPQFCILLSNLRIYVCHRLTMTKNVYRSLYYV